MKLFILNHPLPWVRLYQQVVLLLVHHLSFSASPPNYYSTATCPPYHPPLSSPFLIPPLPSGTSVFEFLDQDLKALLDAVGPVPLDPYVVMSYMYQLLLAIDHCHRSHVLHRDLKPQNILLTNVRIYFIKTLIPTLYK